CGLRSSDDEILAERRELRPDSHWRACRGRHRVREIARRLPSQSIQRTWLRRLPALWRGRRRTHQARPGRARGGAVRRAVIDRQTTETQIALTLTLDGQGRYQVRTGIRFLDHMLELFTRHGGFDLKVNAT